MLGRGAAVRAGAESLQAVELILPRFQGQEPPRNPGRFKGDGLYLSSIDTRASADSLRQVVVAVEERGHGLAGHGVGG